MPPRMSGIIDAAYVLKFRVEGLQGYLAHEKQLPKDPTAGLGLDPYSGPRRGGFFLISEVPL